MSGFAVGEGYRLGSSITHGQVCPRLCSPISCCHCLDSMLRWGNKLCTEVGDGAQAGFSNQIGWWVCSVAT